MRLSKRVKEVFKFPNDPDKGWVELKHLRNNEVQEAIADLNDVSYVPGEAGSVSVKMNSYVRKKRLAKAAIVDWGNVYDLMGKPLEFSEMNIDKVAEFEISIDGQEFGFYDWIDECRDKLSKKVKIEQKAALGN